jgi:hypothetical protein
MSKNEGRYQDSSEVPQFSEVKRAFSLTLNPSPIARGEGDILGCVGEVGRLDRCAI